MIKIQNYLGSGLCPLSRILKTRKHKVLETGEQVKGARHPL
jgi:hypothetical protein